MKEKTAKKSIVHKKDVPSGYSYIKSSSHSMSVRHQGKATTIVFKHDDMIATIRAVRNGLPIHVFLQGARLLNETNDFLAKSLNINPRTLRNRISKQESLSQEESEKTARLWRVIDLGTEILNGKKEASLWLKTPNTSLGNNKPIELLDTDVGYEMVTNALRAIEWGVYL